MFYYYKLLKKTYIVNFRNCIANCMIRNFSLGILCWMERPLCMEGDIGECKVSRLGRPWKSDEV